MTEHANHPANSHDASKAIRPGDRILIRDASGQEWPGVAVSGLERGHKFVRVRVRFDDGWWDDYEDGAPWPADAVRLVEEAAS